MCDYDQGFEKEQQQQQSGSNLRKKIAVAAVMEALMRLSGGRVRLG